jgi:hypothetical protein
MIRRFTPSSAFVGSSGRFWWSDGTGKSLELVPNGKGEFCMTTEGKPVLERTPEEIVDFRDQLRKNASNSENADYVEFCNEWASELDTHLESQKSA